MLQFKNQTPLAGKMFVTPNPEGIDCLYTVLKGTFTLGKKVVPAENPLPIVDKEEYIDRPGQSSVKTPSDFALVKPGTDVLLMGTAYAPGGKPATQLDVSLQAGPIKKTVRVFGDRVWEARLLGTKISATQPFDKMPLAWERAFGGVDQTTDDPPVQLAEARNPVGVGFMAKNGKNRADGMKLPNLEDPKQTIASVKDHPAPACFAPLCPHWQPRRAYAGTYDEAWQKKRAPYLPVDFNPRFFQQAPPNQVTPDYLRGGEPVEILGATPSGTLRFVLPRLDVRVTYRLDEATLVHLPNLDTVLIEPDESRLVLLWRTTLPCDKKALRIREVIVALG
jgi:hypothetical protein